MAVRALIHLPPSPKRGELIEVRATLAHPMETGYRRDSDGAEQPVFSATLYPAIAANPYLAFSWRVAGSGTLLFAWEGDNGFRHAEAVAVPAT
ncbi:thiosulfate oxidation carrier complex protein SoxZ [Aquabacterium sp.]|uniref:thiosulfate oxidation carrier complex protein SoxZ n=1 Tax=Aquabacterium sp. TaxID=1872578 RepID=UPI003784E484